MATAKQRAWRAKFARLYGGRRRAKKYKVHAKRSVHMARRRRYFGRSRRYVRRHGPGAMALLKKAILGYGAGVIVSKTVGDNMIIKGGAGYLVGGIPGAVGAVGGDMAINTAGGLLGGVKSAVGNMPIYN